MSLDLSFKKFDEEFWGNVQIQQVEEAQEQLGSLVDTWSRGYIFLTNSFYAILLTWMICGSAENIYVLQKCQPRQDGIRI